MKKKSIFFLIFFVYFVYDLAILNLYKICYLKLFAGIGS